MAPSAFPNSPLAEKDQSWWGRHVPVSLKNCFPSYSRKDVKLSWLALEVPRRQLQMKRNMCNDKEGKQGWGRNNTRVKLEKLQSPFADLSFLMANSKSAARASNPFLRCVRRNQAQCGGAVRGLLVLRVAMDQSGGLVLLCC